MWRVKDPGWAGRRKDMKAEFGPPVEVLIRSMARSDTRG